mgnify:CR=1 FL=1
MDRWAIRLSRVVCAAYYTMETITQSVTLIIELHIDITDDNVHINANVPVNGSLQSAQSPEATGDFLFDGPDAMTVKEAADLLNSSRGTVDNMRKEGKLTSYNKGRHVRLDRREVEEARKWWSVRKGKV